MNVNFVVDKPFAIESPIAAVEGESIVISCQYWDTASGASAVAYRNKTSVTATVFPAGSITGGGTTTITLKPLTGLVGGARYVIAVTATVDGDVTVRKIEVIVSKDETEQ